MRPLLAASLAVPALLVSGCGPVEAKPPARWGASGGDPPPNVLLVSIDTLRADHLSCYGYERATTPHLDALAARGALFENAHSSSSWTLPGLASLVSGEHSSTHGCWTFVTRLGSDHQTLAERLLAFGYDTASITTNLFTGREYGLQQGIVLAADGSYRSEDGPLELAVTSPRISDSALEYLEAKAEANDGWPWFLWLHYFDPHDTYVEHEGFSERFRTPGATDALVRERDLYDGEVFFTDHHIGRVLDALERLELDERTIVIVVSDHGEEFGDHGLRHHGHSLFTELTRMPFLLKAPGFAPRRIDALAGMVDVLPTVLALVGAEVPADLPGRSLVPLLSDAGLRSLPALTEVRLHPHASYEALRDERWTLIRTLDEGGALALYDAVSDPAEQRDVAAEHADVVARLTPLLSGLVRAAAERSARFGTAQQMVLTEEQYEVIKGLGYAGER